MDNKLFKVPQKKREVILYLSTYKGNRIVIKLMALLICHSIFTIEDVESNGETRIFEISIFSDMDFDSIVSRLKVTIVNLLHDHTPANYLFDLKNRRLGFINSFNVFSNKGFHFEVCHKIKELRTNGGTNIPTNKITL